jgi:hypothetical protein
VNSYILLLMEMDQAPAAVLLVSIGAGSGGKAPLNNVMENT